MEKYAIIVAGGAGVRMGGSIPKQFQLLKGKPVLWHSIKAFVNAFEDVRIILTVAEIYMARTESIIKDFPGTRITITAGGETRFNSVKNGLRLVKETSVVFVHDAVRCLITRHLIHRCYNEAIKKGNAVPAITATDTIRIETGEGNEQIDRSKVRLIQTPQAFLSDLLIHAFDYENASSFTDEAGVVEKSGIKINLIEGESTNIKITVPIDFIVAEKIIGTLEK